MSTEIVTFRDWEFEVDRESTARTYRNTALGGADSCSCNDCKNFAACRDQVFPEDVRNLFERLGIDYRKEVRLVSYETRSDGLHNVAGWFHFRGRMLRGQDCHVPALGGYEIDLTRLNDHFAIGFREGNDLTFFEEKTGLVQVEFDTHIPWVIDKSLEIAD